LLCCFFNGQILTTPLPKNKTKTPQKTTTTTKNLNNQRQSCSKVLGTIWAHPAAAEHLVEKTGAGMLALFGKGAYFLLRLQS
jgi:hypothetical protein